MGETRPSAGWGEVGVSGSIIAVVGSPAVDSTSGLAAALAVSIARSADRSCLLIDLVDGSAPPRPPTLLASAGARGIEERLRAGGWAAVARGHICVVSITDDEWQEAGVGGLLDLVSTTRSVFSLGSDSPRSRLDQLSERLTGCVAMLDLPEERPLAALMVAEMRDHGLRIKVTSRRPGMVAGRRALAGVPPGGAVEAFCEKAARHFSLESGRSRADV